MGLSTCLRWESLISMAQFTTTHTHDYRWPNKHCLVPRAEAPNWRCEVKLGDLPQCQQGPVPIPSFSKLPVSEPPVCHDLVPTPVDRPWCQRGPLVPLVNPKSWSAPARLNPPGCSDVPPSQSRPWCDGNSRSVTARVGAAPQQEISRYNQPDQYLQKLCEKYPRPTAVVTATPRDELKRRVYADRYRTTYQADFCRNSDDTARQMMECDTYQPNNNYTKLNRHEGMNSYGPMEGQMEGYVQCKCGCGCRVLRPLTAPPLAQWPAGDAPSLKLPECRPAAVSQNVHFSCCSPNRPINNTQEEVGPPEKIPPWISEYSDSIARTGQLIMDHKLLHQKKKKH